MRLSIAIDFTGSNGEQTKKSSLHYINPDKTTLNQYEEALQVVGSIVEQYDPEKKFPAIGFGGIPPGFFDVQHCFNLKKWTEYTEILGIEGVLKAYWKMIKGILLYGPTYFSPLLKQFKVWIENCPIDKLYHILLILTDGDVHDLQETVDEIVAMSSLPVSIIIVGLGNEDFAKMEILDGDHGTLVDSKGNRAKKDLVQFVKYQDYKNRSMKELAEEVLWEVPDQFVEQMMM